MACLCGDFGFVWEFERVEDAVDWFSIYLDEEE